MLAAGCGGGPSDPGVQVATQSPGGDSELLPGSTETTAVVDSPPAPESTTTSVTARTAKPKATPTTTSITAIPVTTTAPQPTTTTTARPVATTQPAGPTVVGLGMRPGGRGGWMVRTDGTVIPVGDAPMLGDAAGAGRPLPDGRPLEVADVDGEQPTGPHGSSDGGESPLHRGPIADVVHDMPDRHDGVSLRQRVVGQHQHLQVLDPCGVLPGQPDHRR